jgi:hypothetical protein
VTPGFLLRSRLKISRVQAVAGLRIPFELRPELIQRQSFGYAIPELLQPQHE